MTSKWVGWNASKSFSRIASVTGNEGRGETADALMLELLRRFRRSVPENSDACDVVSFRASRRARRVQELMRDDKT